MTNFTGGELKGKPAIAWIDENGDYQIYTFETVNGSFGKNFKRKGEGKVVARTYNSFMKLTGIDPLKMSNKMNAEFWRQVRYACSLESINA